MCGMRKWSASLKTSAYFKKIFPALIIFSPTYILSNFSNFWFKLVSDFSASNRWICSVICHLFTWLPTFRILLFHCSSHYLIICLKTKHIYDNFSGVSRGKENRLHSIGTDSRGQPHFLSCPAPPPCNTLHQFLQRYNFNLLYFHRLHSPLVERPQFHRNMKKS